MYGSHPLASIPLAVDSSSPLSINPEFCCTEAWDRKRVKTDLLYEGNTAETALSLGSYCLTAITTLTSQNSNSISMIYPVPVKMVISQISTLLKDYNVKGIKIGLISDKRLVKPLCKLLKNLDVSALLRFLSTSPEPYRA